MRRLLRFLLCIIFGLALPLAAQQSHPSSRRLFAALKQIHTTKWATSQILEASTHDPSVQQQAAENLPEMIDKTEIDLVWLNAVRLAGRLKVVETIPSLQRAFYRGQQGRPANMTFGTVALLNDDIVAKALSQIGDPSLPAVGTFLKSDDPKIRERAIRILQNIKSSAAHILLQQQLQIETDARDQYVIKNALERWDQ